MTKRIAILISGGGSNMAQLIDSLTDDHPGRAVLVVSNVPGAGGLQKAEARCANCNRGSPVLCW